jgi:hypothetical protein
MLLHFFIYSIFWDFTFFSSSFFFFTFRPRHSERETWERKRGLGFWEGRGNKETRETQKRRETNAGGLASPWLYFLTLQLLFLACFYPNSSSLFLYYSSTPATTAAADYFFCFYSCCKLAKPSPPFSATDSLATILRFRHYYALFTYLLLLSLPGTSMSTNNVRVCW